jgi:hypothetical protein
LVEAQQNLYESLGGTGANIEQLTLKAKVLFFQNILPAIKIVAKLTASFVAFKIIQGLVNTNFRDLAKNFTKLKTDSTDVTSKMSGFGNALKGIGWSAAIGLAIELGMKLWDVASGAEAARNRMDLFNASMAKGTKFGTEYVATASDKLKADLQDLDLKRANSKISESMYLQEKKNIMENTALKVRTMKNLAIEDMRRTKENMQRLEAGYKAEDGYVYITLKKVKYKRSALVWCLCKKQWPSTRLLLDHINRNKQDDRLENLREVSVAENAWNRKNVKGYTWEPSRKKYKVTIMSEGKRVLIGRFDTEAEASEAYNRAKLLYHQIGETQRSGSDPNQAQENSSR